MRKIKREKKTKGEKGREDTKKDERNKERRK